MKLTIAQLQGPGFEAKAAREGYEQICEVHGTFKGNSCIIKGGDTIFYPPGNKINLNEK